MKVIFRSNDCKAKKKYGQGGAEKKLNVLNKYLSDDALLYLSLFIESNGASLATLDIIDGGTHVYSSVTEDNEVIAVDSVINKCARQLKKVRLSSDYSNESIRYNDESLESTYVELEPAMMDQFEILSVEQRLENEKKTPKYKRVMSKYIDYLYRVNDIERAGEHLRILYSIYENANPEEISVADYDRLVRSIVQIEGEINLMLEKQSHFNSETRDRIYIDQIKEDEAKLAKLKK